jgi:hypothetical protein
MLTRPVAPRCRLSRLLVVAAIGLLLAPQAWPQGNLSQYIRRTIRVGGKTLVEIVVPGRPPAYRMPSVRVPIPNRQAGINTLTDVPALTWSFGCSATSAAIIFGYYDNHGFSNMYAGPTNGGLFPMTNAAWPDVLLNGEWRSQCPLSATRNGIDGRSTRGHVDDYWIKYNDPGPDPYLTNGWTEHAWDDGTADFMGTNQSKYGNSDGATTFWNYGDGTALYDYSSCEPASRDGCHGMRQFAESRGYAILGNYTQYIYPNPVSTANTHGFTFADYEAQIDAGRPVMIQVEGHSMVGFGYDDSTNLMYIRDTWDYSTHTMTFGGSYSGMKHYAVTVLQLQSGDTAPTIALAISGGSTSCTDSNVTLNLTHTDGSVPTEMCFADDNSGAPGTWSGWQSWATTKAWVLPGGYGTKRVWAKARNAYGEGAPVSDTINYIAPPDVLVVDDDANNGYETYYQAALDANGVPYAMWTVYTQGAVTSSLLADYLGPNKLVIWLTGDEFGATLTASDQTALAGFLDAGGRLFVSGQDIGYDISPTSFYANYLHASYVQDDVGLRVIRGVASDPIGGAWAGASVNISGGDGANNQNYPSEVDPTGGGVSCFKYYAGSGVAARYSPPKPGGVRAARRAPITGPSRAVNSTGTAGIRYSDATYKVVYFAFGFEGISAAGSRASVMAAVMGWLRTNQQPPTPPGSVSISPTSPVTTNDLVATASGSTDPDGDAVSYEYEWACSTDGGATWGSWGWSGATLANANTTRNERWKVHARAGDGKDTSAWVESAPVTIGNSAPSAPASATVSPTDPVTTDDLVATPSGATDADGDSLSYECQWARSMDGGTTWGSWGWSGTTLANANTTKGEQWKARARASDGTTAGDWRESSPVAIGNTAPTVPSSVAITPGPRALVGQNLTAAAAGGTDADGDGLRYSYQWCKSTDGGTTWGAWGWQTVTTKTAMVSRTLTSAGDRWKARVATNDGTVDGPFLESAPVIVNTPAAAPTSVVVKPAPLAGDNDSLVATATGSTDAEGDSLRYVYQWCKSTDGGGTWGAWGWTTTSTTTATLDKGQTSPGDRWKARSAANDGYQTGDPTEGSAVTINSAPTAPASVSITPGPRALVGQNLTAAATGATDPDGDSLVYTYQWAKSTDGGSTWSAWGWQAVTAKTAMLSRTLTSAGDRWKARAAANDGRGTGAWLESAMVTVNTPAAAPSSVAINPSPQAGDSDNLVATASGSTDPEGDSLRYVYQWCKSTDGGVTWGAWGWTTTSATTGTLDKGQTTPGDRWKVRSAANDGYQTGLPTESAVVVISAPPTAPTSVTVTPGPRALVGQNLTAAAAGATDPDGDSLSYVYQWSKSTDAGTTWGAWGWQAITSKTAMISRTLTSAGDRWKARAAANDGHSTGVWLESAEVTVNTPATAPSSVVISPSPQAGDNDNLVATASGSTDAESDSLRYVYQWCKSTDGGVTWGAWGWTTTSTTTATLGKSLTSVGEQWKARSGANDGYQTGIATESAVVEITSTGTMASAPLAVTASAATTREQSVAITANLTAAAAVEVSVLNLAGREVAVIPSTRLVAGISTVWWNGRGTYGTRVPAGQYLVRVQARSTDGSSASCLLPLRW